MVENRNDEQMFDHVKLNLFDYDVVVVVVVRKENYCRFDLLSQPMDHYVENDHQD